MPASPSGQDQGQDLSLAESLKPPSSIQKVDAKAVMGVPPKAGWFISWKMPLKFG